MRLLIFNGSDPNAVNFQEQTPLLLAIKKNQKLAILDIIKINNVLKQKKISIFDLNIVDPSSKFNALYLLMKYKQWELAEDVFMNGGDALLNLINWFKRTGFDADSIKVRYNK